MNKIIEFPDADAQKLIQAKKAMEQQEWLRAKSLFEALLQKGGAKDAFFIDYLQVLQHLGEFSYAIQKMRQAGNTFLIENYEWYLHLIMLNEEWLMAHRLLVKRPNSTLLAELEQLESLQPLLYPTLLEEKRGMLLRFAEQSQPPLPKEWGKFREKLTLPQLFELSRAYLPRAKNPFLVPKLVEELVCCGAIGSVEIQTIFDETLSCELSSVKSLVEEQIFIEILENLEKELEQYPGLFEVARGEVHSQMALMYPFLPEEIVTWSNYYQKYIYYQFFEEESLPDYSDEEAQIHQKTEKIRAIYQKIIEN